MVGKILAAIALSALATVPLWATLLMSKQSWRQCLGCGRYFADDGEVREVDSPPLVCGPDIVCAACSAKARYRA